MTRAMFVPFLLIALAVVRVLAAEPQPEPKAAPQPAASEQTPQEPPVADETASPQEEAAEVTEPVIPKRELVFEDKEEPLELRLVAADPELLQQRFVALIRLDGSQCFLPVRWRQSDAMNATRSMLLSTRGTPTTLLQNLAGNAPKDRLPSPEVVEALTDRTTLHVGGYRVLMDRVRTGQPGRPQNSSLKVSIVFEVYAPTRERAKELTRAVIGLFDFGFSYPMQRDWLLVKQETQERLAARRAALQGIEAEIAGCQKQLEAFAEYEDVTPEALNGLITQQRLIAVDLAGVRARIDVCKKLLAGRDLRPSQIEQVEQIQIAAEIELVGLEARKASIDLIVEKVAKRRELSDKLAELQEKGPSADTTIRVHINQIEELETERPRFMPPAVEGGVIPIHPIKWKAADEPPGHASPPWWEKQTGPEE